MCFSHSRDSQVWLGLVAFVVGAVLLLQRFDLVPPETWDYLLPSILVVSGLKWMIRSNREASCCDGSDACGACGDDACGGCGSCEMPMMMPEMPKAAKKNGKKKSKK
ncbi:MAG: hypothetical protein WC777_05455 [Candidatus Gracilibacteria bacterium]|jgi:hypothetical protein